MTKEFMKSQADTRVDQYGRDNQSMLPCAYPRKLAIYANCKSYELICKISTYFIKADNLRYFKVNCGECGYPLFQDIIEIIENNISLDKDELYALVRDTLDEYVRSQEEGQAGAINTAYAIEQADYILGQFWWHFSDVPQGRYDINRDTLERSIDNLKVIPF